MQRVQKGNKLLAAGPFVWKWLPGKLLAVKVSYTDDEGRTLYAIFDENHVATGEHLTLDQVKERSGN
jgi:hypothetical protein